MYPETQHYYIHDLQGLPMVLDGIAREGEEWELLDTLCYRGPHSKCRSPRQIHQQLIDMAEKRRRIKNGAWSLVPNSRLEGLNPMTILIKKNTYQIQFSQRKVFVSIIMLLINPNN